jgi:hypothetical protein
MTPGTDTQGLCVGCAQRMGKATGIVNSDIILESTGPRLYSRTFALYAATALQGASSFVGEIQVTMTPSALRQVSSLFMSLFSSLLLPYESWGMGRLRVALAHKITCHGVAFSWVIRYSITLSVDMSGLQLIALSLARCCWERAESAALL